MFFGYGLLSTRCLHEPAENFTDALFAEDCSAFRLALLQTINDYAAKKTWTEIRNLPHFRHVNKRERVISLIEKGGTNKKVITSLVTRPIYQIALGEERTVKGESTNKFRAYGVIRELTGDFLFEFLFFDPNHLFNRSTWKSQYPYGSEAICLKNYLRKEKKWANCSALSQEPKDKSSMRSLRKKDKQIS